MASNSKRRQNRNKKRRKFKKDLQVKCSDNISELEQADPIPIEPCDNSEGTHEDNLKRQHEDDDSDSEPTPKKKKKKKQPVPAETSDKKGKKSIRQMKREKHLQRQAEADMAAKDQLKSQCQNYLSQWKHDRQNWKFMKAKQVWLFKNKFTTDLIPNDSWPLLLEYFEAAQGNIRNMLLEDANKVIKQMDEWTEKQETAATADEEIDEEDSNKPSETAYSRARDIIQCLQ